MKNKIINWVKNNPIKTTILSFILIMMIFGFINDENKKIEHERNIKIQDSIDFIQNQKDLKRNLEISEKFLVTKIYGKMNSASGIDVYIHYKNNTSKTIKYVTYKIKFYNAVNDPIRCNITNDRLFYVKATGPIKHNKSDYSLWETVMYNSTAEKVVLRDVIIEFMDGEMVEFSISDSLNVNNKKCNITYESYY